ncbi:MAG: hypothetical protein J0L96_14775 [Anaerolineae bacterium]|nr:hypothetical protein [Anaerolineae bacterium]
METLEEKKVFVTALPIDPNTGEILTPLKWDAEAKRYFPTTKAALSIWELHLIEGSARLRDWANEQARKRGYR